jgi:hypothetical protein
VEELTKDKAELKRSNDLMRTQLDLLEQQNRTLLMNQLSNQTSSQMNGGNYIPGGHFSSLSMPNHVGSHASGVGGMPMFNLSSTGFGASGTGTIGSGNIVGGASSLSNTSVSFMGGGAGGGGGTSLGQISLLDRLRLQQQLQLQQQQQQLDLMAPSTGENDRTSLNDQDLTLNNMRNNNSNSNNFLG